MDVACPFSSAASINQQVQVARGYTLTHNCHINPDDRLRCSEFLQIADNLCCPCRCLCVPPCPQISAAFKPEHDDVEYSQGKYMLKMLGLQVRQHNTQ